MKIAASWIIITTQYFGTTVRFSDYDLLIHLKMILVTSCHLFEIACLTHLSLYESNKLESM